MRPSTDALKDRLAATARSRSASSEGNPGRRSRFRSGSCLKTKRFTSYPCKARRPSGTKTCSRTQRFGLMRVAWKRNSGQSQSPAGPKAVKSVVEKFRETYGAKDVKKYYSKFDEAVVAKLA